MFENATKPFLPVVLAGPALQLHLSVPIHLQEHNERPFQLLLIPFHLQRHLDELDFIKIVTRMKVLSNLAVLVGLADHQILLSPFHLFLQ